MAGAGFNHFLQALYRTFRNYGATNSLHARKSVAFAFSGFVPTPINQGFPAEKILVNCFNHEVTEYNVLTGTRIWLYFPSDGTIQAQLDFIDGIPMLTKTWLQVPTELMDSIPATTLHWLPTNSDLESGLTVALAVETVVQESKIVKHIGIGMGLQPYVPAYAPFNCKCGVG